MINYPNQTNNSVCVISDKSQADLSRFETLEKQKSK